jgi:glycosyltransferase involved in cell wall biosynthesis
MKVAICMIVKNEEAMLSRCLDSVKGFDYLVICDTGSTDKTVEIAKKYTDRVYTDYKWEDSFCKARNYAKSKVPKDAEWILSIDADEYLENTYEQVKDVARQAKANVVSVNVKAENTGTVHKFPRLFKNIPEVYWVNDIHNLLNITSREYCDITIVYGYSPAHKLDPERTMRILLKSLVENPKLVREKYYLAREYYYRKWWKKAIDMFNKYVKESKFRGERADAYLMKAKCHWNLQEGEQARVACMYAILTNPDFKEALRFMAEMNYEPRKSTWLKFAEIASNNEVLFIRDGKNANK